MKNKPWLNARTAIELTSLLDVIFIVLMIVVCNQQINTKNQLDRAKAVLTEAEAMVEGAAAREDKLARLEARAFKEIAEAEEMKAREADVLAERDFYKEQLDTYENLSEQVLAVTVFVDYDPENIKERQIRIIVGTLEQEPIPLNPETPGEAFNELERRLRTVVFEKKDIPVIVAVSRGQILYRDERAVSAVLTKLAGEHTNLFRK